MNRRTWIPCGLAWCSCILVCSSLLSCAGDDPRPPSASKPNVVLILADDLGVECLGSYGGTSWRTPALDRMAKEGLRFTECHAQPLCTPSRVKLLTGLYNSRNYVAFSILRRGERTLGHLFQEYGYRTAVAGKWQLRGAEHYPKGIRDTGMLPGAAGFDRWCLWQVTKLGRRYWSPLLEIDGELVEGRKDDYGPERFTQYLLDFIEENRERPFFAFYPMALVHAPFLPSPLSKSKSRKPSPEHFASMIEEADRNVGRILKSLQDLGIAERTLVMFVGDNGTPRKIRSRQGSRVVRGGKGTTRDSGHHVPFLAWWPKRIAAGGTCSDLTDLTDFRASFSELLGEPVQQRRTHDGRSFLATLMGRKGRPKRALPFHYHPRPKTRKRSRAVRFAIDHDWKLYEDGRLYARQRDPMEKQGVLPGSPEDPGADLRATLRAALRSLDEPPRGGRP